MIDAVLNPHHPIPPAAICDFGIDSHEHWEAIYYAVALGGVTADDVHQALMEGGGRALTALLRSVAGNPHPHLTFRLVWDQGDMQEPPGNGDVSDDS